MKIKLLTMNGPSYEPLAAITGPNKIEYCVRHGIEFQSMKFAGDMTCWDRPRAWLRTLYAMNEGEWLWFMGCDTLITNQPLNIHLLVELGNAYKRRMLFACDGNGPNIDVFVMQRCEATMDFLRRICLHEPLETANEQDAWCIELSGSKDYNAYCDRVGMELRQGGAGASPLLVAKLNELFSYDEKIHPWILPQCQLNAYPMQCYGRTNDEPGAWHPGDFILHMPGKSLQERLEFFPTVPITQ